MPVAAAPISNGLAPKSLPKALRYDALLVQNVDFDLTQEQDGNDIEFVQAIWVDNRLNAGRLQIDVNGVPFTVIVPATAMGMFPILAGGHFRCRLTALGVVTGSIPLVFLNVPQPYFVYQP